MNRKFKNELSTVLFSLLMLTSLQDHANSEPGKYQNKTQYLDKAQGCSRSIQKVSIDRNVVDANKEIADKDITSVILRISNTDSGCDKSPFLMTDSTGLGMTVLLAPGETKEVPWIIRDTDLVAGNTLTMTVNSPTHMDQMVNLTIE